MRLGLTLALATTVVASVVALLWPNPLSHPVADGREGRGSNDVTSISRANELASAISTPRYALPERLPHFEFAEAHFDPFVGLVTPVPPTAPATVVSLPPLPPAAPERSMPPVLKYRFLGSFTDPNGNRIVYLTRGDKDVRVAVGTQLDEGYVVEAIDVDGVRLLFPPLDARATIAIPNASEPRPS